MRRAKRSSLVSMAPISRAQIVAIASRLRAIPNLAALSLVGLSLVVLSLSASWDGGLSENRHPSPDHASNAETEHPRDWRVPVTSLYCQSAPVRAARPLIRFRKNSSAMCGPQGPHPDRPGCPARPPRHPKEWCNMALYARGQRAAANGCRPAPAALRWY